KQRQRSSGMTVRRIWFIWLPVGVLVTLVVGLILTVLALRFWPDSVVPALPLRSLGLARMVATDAGVVRIERCLHEAALSHLLDAGVGIEADRLGIGPATEMRAWALLPLLGDGYDHRTPNRFRTRLEVL